MGNNYFQFKQFTVGQEKCAMKVSTEACILGAYTAASCTATSAQILDIGTGSALLALMLAQQLEGKIQGVEIERSAFLQASENIEASPWKGKISIHHQSIQEFTQFCDQKFQLIVSNPPFYTGHLLPDNEKKRLAHHNDSLPLNDLADSVKKLLDIKGFFYVLLPVSESQTLVNILLQKGLFLHSQVSIRSSPDHKPRSVISVFAYCKTEKTHYKELIIKKGVNYTPDFIKLLKPYYLNI